MLIIAGALSLLAPAVALAGPHRPAHHHHVITHHHHHIAVRHHHHH